MKRKKPHHFSANIRNVSGNNKIPLFFRAFALRGSAAPGGGPRTSGCSSLRGQGGPPSRAVPSRDEPCGAEPSRAEPFPPPGPADKAAANCRRLGFGGPLCTRLAFPSDRTAAKFDFVHSEGSLDLCSLPVCKWYASGPFAITFKMHPRHRLSGERWPLPQPGWKLDFKVPRWNFQVRDAGLDQIT